MKHPAGQMIWGCFSYHGIGHIQFIKGTVNAAAYRHILEENLFPSLEEHLAHESECIFLLKIIENVWYEGFTYFKAKGGTTKY